MGWFKRLKDGVHTATKFKKEAPDGLWYKCKCCNEVSTRRELEENVHKCPHCDHHVRIDSLTYFSLLFDGKYELLFEELSSYDVLTFTDLKSYPDRLAAARAKNEVTDAITVGYGQIKRKPIVIAAMNFSFIGGSMGAVVGERIARAVDHAIEQGCPLLIISKSGGARMMEAAFSLMQMAKTSVKLAQLGQAGLPYLSLLTDPTTGGVTASYAMLGDVNFAEPGALIAFAGPRVIKETIKKELPEGFQTSEFLLDRGFLDFIVDRTELKDRIADVMAILQPTPVAATT